MDCIHLLPSAGINVDDMVPFELGPACNKLLADLGRNLNFMGRFQRHLSALTEGLREHAFQLPRRTLPESRASFAQLSHKIPLKLEFRFFYLQGKVFVLLQPSRAKIAGDSNAITRRTNS